MSTRGGRSGRRSSPVERQALTSVVAPAFYTSLDSMVSVQAEWGPEYVELLRQILAGDPLNLIAERRGVPLENVEKDYRRLIDLMQFLHRQSWTAAEAGAWGFDSSDMRLFMDQIRVAFVQEPEVDFLRCPYHPWDRASELVPREDRYCEECPCLLPASTGGRPRKVCTPACRSRKDRRKKAGEPPQWRNGFWIGRGADRELAPEVLEDFSWPSDPHANRHIQQRPWFRGRSL